MRLAIMRHGQIPANAAHAYAGALDEPLTEQGRAEARAAGVLPDVGLVYVSPLIRARQTASICFPNAEQVIVEGLREMDFGAFEGRSADDMADDAAYRAWVESGCTTRCPGGEDRAQFTERVAHAVEWVCRDAQARGLSWALVVGHGGTLMAAFASFASDSPERDYFSWRAPNCGGYHARVSFEGETLRLADCMAFEHLSFLDEDAS